jgi:hypothetical protein
MFNLVLPYEGKPGTREIITPGDTATGITKAIRHPVTGRFKGKNAKCAVVQNKSLNNAKFTIEGTAPTALAGTNIGLILTPYASFTISDVDAIGDFLVIDDVSGSASVIEVLCYF